MIDKKYSKNCLAISLRLSCALQLNRIQDGKYTIASAALLLSDPLSLTRFLLEWARIRTEIKEKNMAVIGCTQVATDIIQ